ncbi:MAG: hypothetical protein WCW01_07090, partial [Gammaproteobacteria bacterium]
MTTTTPNLRSTSSEPNLPRFIQNFFDDWFSPENQSTPSQKESLLQRLRDELQDIQSHVKENIPQISSEDWDGAPAPKGLIARSYFEKNPLDKYPFDGAGPVDGEGPVVEEEPLDNKKIKINSIVLYALLHSPKVWDENFAMVLGYFLASSSIIFTPQNGRIDCFGVSYPRSLISELNTLQFLHNINHTRTINTSTPIYVYSPENFDFSGFNLGCIENLGDCIINSVQLINAINALSVDLCDKLLRKLGTNNLYNVAKINGYQTLVHILSSITDPENRALFLQTLGTQNLKNIIGNFQQLSAMVENNAMHLGIFGELFRTLEPLLPEIITNLNECKKLKELFDNLSYLDSYPEPLPEIDELEKYYRNTAATTPTSANTAANNTTTQPTISSNPSRIFGNPVSSGSSSTTSASGSSSSSSPASVPSLLPESTQPADLQQRSDYEDLRETLEILRTEYAIEVSTATTVNSIEISELAMLLYVNQQKTKRETTPTTNDIIVILARLCEGKHNQKKPLFEEFRLTLLNIFCKKRIERVDQLLHMFSYKLFHPELRGADNLDLSGTFRSIEPTLFKGFFTNIDNLIKLLKSIAQFTNCIQLTQELIETLGPEVLGPINDNEDSIAAIKSFIREEALPTTRSFPLADFTSST